MLPESSSFVMLGLHVRWVFSGHGSADLRPLGWAQAVENLAEQSLRLLAGWRVAIGSGEEANLVGQASLLVLSHAVVRRWVR